MNQNKNHIFAIMALCFGALIIFPARVTSQTKVPRSEWTGGVTLPSYITMQIYVPTKLATKPPIVVSNHACGSTVSGQMGANTKIKAAADKNGFIMILPENQVTESGGSTGQNCWDVGSDQALKHDGGGDPHAVAQMVRYALKKYNGDSSRVYVLGGSSGGMMTQALLGIYPEIFVAGAPRAGVPCGCWAVEYDKCGTKQWSCPCANGTVSHTPKEWGDIVRNINPNYTGHRPRVQIMQGDADATISYKNMGESIKQWTNVLGLDTVPDSTKQITSSASGKTYTYNCKFWKNKCGYVVLESWFAVGQPHSMNYEEDAILKFFGLDAAGGKDPELAACATEIRGLSALHGTADKPIIFKEKALVLNSIKADKVSIRITNAAGRIQYNEDHLIRSAKASTSVPVSFLHAGYYIVSAIFYEGNKQIRHDNLHFVVTE